MKLLSSVLFCLMSCVLALAANSALSSQELTSRQKHIITIAAYTGRGDLHQLRVSAKPEGVADIHLRAG